MYYDVIYLTEPDEEYLEIKTLVTTPEGKTFWHCLVSEKNFGLLPSKYIKWDAAPLWMKRADGGALHEYMGRRSILTKRDGGFKVDEL